MCELSYGFVWVNFHFLKEKWSWETACLKKYIQNYLWISLTFYFDILFAHIKYNCKQLQLSSYNSEHENELFKSEYGLCILKNSKQQIHTGEILWAYKIYMRHY